jgi:hypothetical protein
LDKRDFFKEGAIALEALSETTNGDADSVVMNPACQSPKFFEAQSTADSADEKSGLACTGFAKIRLSALQFDVEVAAFVARRSWPGARLKNQRSIIVWGWLAIAGFGNCWRLNSRGSASRPFYVAEWRAALQSSNIKPSKVGLAVGRVIGKAEVLGDKDNPRFTRTRLSGEVFTPSAPSVC